MTIKKILSYITTSHGKYLSNGKNIRIKLKQIFNFYRKCLWMTKILIILKHSSEKIFAINVMNVNLRINGKDQK